MSKYKLHPVPAELAELTPGQRIRHLRKAKKMTQRTLATLCGCGHSSVVEWESGRYLPNLAAGTLAAAALGAWPEWFAFAEIPE